MALFGRRRAALPAAEPTAVTIAPIRTVGAVPGPVGYATGWRPVPGVLAPDQQVGAFAGSQLTMRGGSQLEVQRRQGVEQLTARWYVPPKLAGGTVGQLNAAAVQQPGFQRVNGGSSGQLGPITARRMRQAVTAAQIRQSGLDAMAWARSLSPQ